MLGDRSCDFQTNSVVEVALMLQTDVTSPRSSWKTGMFLMEQECHLVPTYCQGSRPTTRGTKDSGHSKHLLKVSTAKRLEIFYFSSDIQICQGNK